VVGSTKSGEWSVSCPGATPGVCRVSVHFGPSLCLCVCLGWRGNRPSCDFRSVLGELLTHGEPSGHMHAHMSPMHNLLVFSLPKRYLHAHRLFGPSRPHLSLLFCLPCMLTSYCACFPCWCVCFRWCRWRCLAVWAWMLWCRCPPSRPLVGKELAWQRALSWACW
jgi:hypothetical protein